eukprot:366257-Chlamydomonas_euryale.AAC.1
MHTHDRNVHTRHTVFTHGTQCSHTAHSVHTQHAVFTHSTQCSHTARSVHTVARTARLPHLAQRWQALSRPVATQPRAAGLQQLRRSRERGRRRQPVHDALGERDCAWRRRQHLLGPHNDRRVGRGDAVRHLTCGGACAGRGRKRTKICFVSMCGGEEWMVKCGWGRGGEGARWDPRRF